MKREYEMRSLLVSIAAMFMVIAIATYPGSYARGDSSKSAKQNTALLPSNLFVNAPPLNALEIGEARKTAQEGKPIVIKGRIGGTAKPIADKYALFLMTDMSLALCKDGCADFCQIPKQELLEKVATVQVVDGNGRPIKSSIDVTNGVKPLAEVIVQGTVAKKDANVLIVNAQTIYVNNGGQKGK